MVIQICIIRLAQVTKTLNCKNTSLVTSAVEFVNAGFHHVQWFAFGFLPRSRWPLATTIDSISRMRWSSREGGWRRVFYYANPPHSVCKNSATAESKPNNEHYTQRNKRKTENRTAGRNKYTEVQNIYTLANHTHCFYSHYFQTYPSATCKFRMAAKFKPICAERPVWQTLSKWMGECVCAHARK
jgi:hypothetical protein